MTTVTTKAIAKVAAVATGLAMATSMLSLAPMAHAAALTSAQVQSILSLLSSFGADSTTIANVNASLTGGTMTTSGSTTTTTSSGYTFTRDLTIGSTGADVTALQNALKAGGYMSANATGYFGVLTQAGVIAWQKAAGVAPAAGYFGAISRAHWNLGGSTSGTTTTTTTTTTTGAGTGTGLKVSLAATSPNGSVLVQKQGIGDLGEFVFSNPTSAPINVTGLSFKRIGVSNDQTLTNVYLYNGGTRLTDSAGISNSAFNFSDPVAIFTVPAGQTYTVAVRSDIADLTSGQQIGVSLVSATSNGTLDSSVVFPINGGYQTVSAANLATVNYGASVTPSGNTSVSPQNDYPVWQSNISVSTNAVKLSSMRFTNLGSIDSSALVNLRLMVDGVQAGAAVPGMGANRTITFDLSAAPVLLSTQSHVVKVLANITGGASRTIVMSVQRSSDAMFIDSQLNQPVTPVNSNGSNFSAQNTGTITINSVTANTGISVSVDPASPNQAVAVGATNVKFASFDMLASGENVKVSDLFVTASSSKSGLIQGAGGLKNGKIFLNGVQVGSTKDIGAAQANGVAASDTVTDFSLGSSLILPAGQTVVVDVYGDAKDTANLNYTNTTSVVVTLKSATNNAQGLASLQSANVPSSSTSGNSISITTSTLTATKYSGYGSQTFVAGSNNAKIGAFTLSAGSNEGVTVNTIAVTLSGTSNASVTNLTLKDDATGAVLGNVQTTPSAGVGANSFNVNLAIARSASKTINIYANVLSGANPGTMFATVENTTAGTGDVTGQPASVTQAILQTITVGNGTLTITRAAGDPVSNNVLAGASSVKVGSFNFAGQNTWYTVQNLAVLVPNGAATSVTGVTVSYKDVNGATQTASQALAVSATLPFATATFTGLQMYVPMNDSANLDVFVGTPTVASGATSGAGINVALSEGNTNTALDNTFRAVTSAGSAITAPNGSFVATIASNGTFYVRKSIPTFAMINTNTTVPATGSPIYKFSITADPAGAIEWSHLVFNVATSGTNTAVTNVFLTDDASGNSLLDTGTFASTTQSLITIDLPTNNITLAKFAQVDAGATKTYDLYGTVAGFTTGSTVTLSLKSDGTPPAVNGQATSGGTGTITVGAGNGVVGTGAAGVIWSDRSSTSHSILSSDWTNGALLKNFTSNAISYSK